jgi:hypothetical protein
MNVVKHIVEKKDCGVAVVTVYSDGSTGEVYKGMIMLNLSALYQKKKYEEFVAHEFFPALGQFYTVSNNQARFSERVAIVRTLAEYFKVQLSITDRVSLGQACQSLRDLVVPPVHQEMVEVQSLSERLSENAARKSKVDAERKWLPMSDRDLVEGDPRDPFYMSKKAARTKETMYGSKFIVGCATEGVEITSVERQQLLVTAVFNPVYFPQEFLRITGRRFDADDSWSYGYCYAAMLSVGFQKSLIAKMRLPVYMDDISYRHLSTLVSDLSFTKYVYLTVHGSNMIHLRVCRDPALVVSGYDRVESITLWRALGRFFSLESEGRDVRWCVERSCFIGIVPVLSVKGIVDTSQAVCVASEISGSITAEAVTVRVSERQLFTFRTYNGMRLVDTVYSDDYSAFVDAFLNVAVSYGRLANNVNKALLAYSQIVSYGETYDSQQYKETVQRFQKSMSSVVNSIDNDLGLRVEIVPQILQYHRFLIVDGSSRHSLTG